MLFLKYKNHFLDTPACCNEDEDDMDGFQQKLSSYVWLYYCSFQTTFREVISFDLGKPGPTRKSGQKRNRHSQYMNLGWPAPNPCCFPSAQRCFCTWWTSSLSPFSSAPGETPKVGHRADPSFTWRGSLSWGTLLLVMLLYLVSVQGEF
jgi:hypothetical protein